MSHIPDFEIDYEVDPVRESIARSWPHRIDDTAAHDEWDWSPQHDMASMTEDMIKELSARQH